MEWSSFGEIKSIHILPPTKATEKATEATSKGFESDKEATKKAQIGAIRRNYKSIQISTGKPVK